MYRVETKPSVERTKSKAGRFVGALGAFTLLGFAGLWQGNKAFAPEMYTRQGSVEIAEAFASGRNYAVFDLNINIRELRDEHIQRMVKTPDVVVLGASHWQEAHDWLIGHKQFYNAHIHRDYYEDMLAMVEMFVRHDRLPKQMIIAIRDNLFTPVGDRKDHLWLPGVPYYEAMAKRLGIAAHPAWETAPYQRWRELASLPMFYTNASRYANATFRPRRTYEAEHAKLDTLLPGGSIVWSHEHQALFTAKRTRELSDTFAAQKINDPPKIDPKGVEHIDRLLQFLKDNGVEVYLAHPPFNPDYYQQVMKGPYAVGLRKVEELTQNFADKYGWQVIGSFNPADIGCESRMFIDAEHGSPECLAKLFNEFTAIDIAKSPHQSPEQPLVISDATTVGQSVRHRIAVAKAQATPLLHDETARADASTTVVEEEPKPIEAGRTQVTPPTIVVRPSAAPQPSAPVAPPADTVPSASQPKKIAIVPVERPVAGSPSQAQAQKARTPNRAGPKATAVRKMVRYPLVARTKISKAAALSCSPYVWPGDHAYPDRVKQVCGYRSSKVRGH